MSNRHITLTVRDGFNTMTISDTLHEGSTWMAQAYLFHKFLLAQGYVLDGECVGADVQSYCDSVSMMDSEMPEII